MRQSFSRALALTLVLPYLIAFRFWLEQPVSVGLAAPRLCSVIGAIQRLRSVTVKLQFRSMAKPHNIVGPQVRKLRYQQEITQEALAARCGVLGWDLSRATLSKIEAQLRCVTDGELRILAHALKVNLDDLYPSAAKATSRRR